MLNIRSSSKALQINSIPSLLKSKILAAAITLALGPLAIAQDMDFKIPGQDANSPTNPKVSVLCQGGRLLLGQVAPKNWDLEKKMEIEAVSQTVTIGVLGNSLITLRYHSAAAAGPFDAIELEGQSLQMSATAMAPILNDYGLASLRVQSATASYLVICQVSEPAPALDLQN